jgi:RHS repeat-associated protein
MHQWNANTYAFTSPYRFNSKELDPETGLAYYGARYYQNKIGVWLSVDPLAHKLPSLSPYVFCYNNPVMFVDPDGRIAGDFYDENDNFIGSDGINDGKVYVIKTSEATMANGQDHVPAAGQSKRTSKEVMNFVRDNSGNTQAFMDKPDIYDKFVELPGSSQERNDAMNYSNSSAQDFKGLESSYESATFTNQNGSYTRSTMAIGQELVPGESQVDLVFAPMEGRKGWDVRLIFHSHPAANTKGISLSQPPSLHDVKNSKSSMRVVHGQGSGKVYLYNNGQIQAVISPQTFRR